MASIKGVDDLVEIVGDDGRTVVFDAYQFQSAEIKQVYHPVTPRYQMWVRYGTVASDAGYPDCFSVVIETKTEEEVTLFKNTLIGVLKYAKTYQGELRKV